MGGSAAPHPTPLIELPSKRARLVCGGVEIEIEVGGVVEDRINLVSAGVHATCHHMVLAIVVLVVKKLDPVRTVVVARCTVEVKSGYRTVKPLPPHDVAHSFVTRIEIQSCHAPPIAIPAIFELGTAQPNIEPAVIVNLLRRRRARHPKHQNRGSKRQTRNSPKFANAYAVQHFETFLVIS